MVCLEGLIRGSIFFGAVLQYLFKKLKKRVNNKGLIKKNNILIISSLRAKALLCEFFI